MTAWKLRPIVLEIGMAIIPLLASLLVLAVDPMNIQAAKMLILLLAVSSLGILVQRLRRGLTLGTIGSVTFLGGFILWYSYPALVSLIASESDFPYDDTAISTTETLVWTTLYLSVFLAAGVFTSFMV